MYKKGVIIGTFDFVTRTHEDVFFHAASRSQEIVLVILATYSDIPDLGMRMAATRRCFPTVEHKLSLPPIAEHQFEPPDSPESRLTQYGRYFRTYMDRPRNVWNDVGCLFTAEEDDVLIAKAMRIDCEVVENKRGNVSNNDIREEIFNAGSVAAMTKYQHLLHPKILDFYGSTNIYSTKRSYIYDYAD